MNERGHKSGYFYLKYECITCKVAKKYVGRSAATLVPHIIVCLSAMSVWALMYSSASTRGPPQLATQSYLFFALALIATNVAIPRTDEVIKSLQNNSFFVLPLQPPSE